MISLTNICILIFFYKIVFFKEIKVQIFLTQYYRQKQRPLMMMEFFQNNRFILIKWIQSSGFKRRSLECCKVQDKLERCWFTSVELHKSEDRQLLHDKRDAVWPLGGTVALNIFVCALPVFSDFILVILQKHKGKHYF